ncbi:MAG: hypothetical protein IJH64_02870, partial [Oscillospiraceae bacterium]|nr:hypothetical protein [Oscillospiraceae bacterium]
RESNPRRKLGKLYRNMHFSTEPPNVEQQVEQSAVILHHITMLNLPCSQVRNDMLEERNLKKSHPYSVLHLQYLELNQLEIVLSCSRFLSDRF